MTFQINPILQNFDQIFLYIEIVYNPVECSNIECGQLYCASCVEVQQKSSSLSADRFCKVCKITALFKQPSQFVLKTLSSYSIQCSHCQKPYPVKEVVTHEGACKKLKCSNELCGLSLQNKQFFQKNHPNFEHKNIIQNHLIFKKNNLEGMPDTYSFVMNGEEFVACSKKCKKVTRFSIMLKRNNETEVLRAFELMLRKKIEKKQKLIQYNNQSISNVNNHIFSYQTISHNKGITQRNESLDHSQHLTPHQKRQGFASQRKAKSDVEENKDFQLFIQFQNPKKDQSRLNIPMFGFLSEYHEFCWDSDNSSKEVVFSHDYRHAFLCESNYYFRTVISNRPFSDGVHYWEIIADARTEHELKVGVTTQQTFNVNSSFSDYDFGFAYYGLGQLRHGSNAVGKPYGKQFKKKGILGVCLNMNQGTLSFALDGEFMGVAFEDQSLKKGPIYAAISLLHIAGFTLISGLQKPSYFP